MRKEFLVIFEVFLRLNSDLLDMISCFVTAVTTTIHSTQCLGTKAPKGSNQKGKGRRDIHHNC